MEKIVLTPDELDMLKKEGKMTKRVKILDEFLTEDDGDSVFENIPKGYQVHVGEMDQDLDTDFDLTDMKPSNSKYLLFQDFIIFDPSRHKCE